MSSSNRALVLFSGGQDSTTCLAWALSHFDHVETIGFDYGQRNSVELVQRPEILSEIRAIFPDRDKRLGEDHIIDLSLVSNLSETAMTGEMKIRMMENGLPNTFVPGRNLFFLMTAATLAYRRQMDILVGGMCETDSSGYPDCRDDAIKAFETALNLGMNARFRIKTPLMWMDKAKIWNLAFELGGKKLIELIRKKTHTCYLGNRQDFHEWGYGCATCPACELRKKGYFIFSEKNLPE